MEAKKTMNTAGDNMLSRIIKTVSSPSLTSLMGGELPPLNFTPSKLPRLKAGRLLLEVDGVQRQWESYIVALVGTDVSNLALYYYKDAADKTPVGAIRLHSASVDLMEEIFCVITQEHTWYLCAESHQEAEEWADKICGTLEAAATGTSLQPLHDSTQNAGSGRRRRLSSHVTAATVKEIQARDGATRVDEFLEVYLRSTEDEIRNQAARGAFSWSCMRSITWRIWLGVLPHDAPLGLWQGLVKEHRDRYEALRTSYALDVKALFDESSTEDGSRASDVAHAILHDVRRTRSSMHYFREEYVQHLLLRVLYVYSQEHPHVSYNQGMGELLAIIVYLLHVEKWPVGASHDGNYIGDDDDSDADDAFDDDSYVHVDMIEVDAALMDTAMLFHSSPFRVHRAKCTPYVLFMACCHPSVVPSACKEAIGALLCTVTDGDWIEHDAYALFEQVMARMAAVYSPQAPTQSPGLATADLSASTTSLHLQLDRIHRHLLVRCDAAIARHLDALHVPPEVYLLRWVRLLLAREFPVYQVWVIWDAIFSLSPADFGFADVLCVAMVLESRADVLAQEDAAGVLGLLKDTTVSCSAKMRSPTLD
ncbi:Aste57867_23367 [Aphanomyces stellatus]|uniref:Aste57867_23367 protein n=1 Tax=Aphanomyces stellatus TaxID=120398 RepID=A0A485LMP5_9STRA|nr:hypothetical protein As57867_023296 [Aphanomyces stellatus]VFU00013.1 Aste57867_23367 [Aphanomyces stellatus]